MDNKLSEEMKTEKDFIEKMESSDLSEKNLKNSNNSTYADEERKKLQQEVIIKAKEEHKEEKDDSVVNKPNNSFNNLQPSSNSESVVEENTVVKKPQKESGVYVHTTASEQSAPWDDKPKEYREPKIEHVTLEVTAKREPEDSAILDVAKKAREDEVKKPVKQEKEVSVVSAAEAAIIKENEENGLQIGKEIIEDDMDQRVRNENIEIRKINESRLGEIEDDDLTAEKVIETFNNNYEDSEVAKTSTNKEVEVVDDSNEPKPEKPKPLEEAPKVDEQLHEHKYLGGDGVHKSFKLRTAKVSKILKNINVQDTNSITATDISRKTQKEQQNIYMTTVLPTLQPRYSVVPFIVSGVVITMTAFQWVDIKDILEIEEKVDDLDPSSDDYIYNKNLLFLEKREKQMDIFYKHIYSVSGFETKPSKHKLFSEIIKFPDFQQLFFAAYAATFQKPTTIGLTCATCGSTHELSVGSKDLCFLLNKHIEYEKLNKYIEKGAISGSSTAEVYEEFQKEKVVEAANNVYRIQQKLPISSFIYEIQVPYVEQAYAALAEVIEKFRDKSLEYIDEDSEQVVSIDSTFGLPDYLIELRKYIYLKSLLVPQIIEESSSSAKVSYIKFGDIDGIIDSVYNLSPEDYNSLMNDPRLKSIMNVSGIRHLIDGKRCPEESCGAELGLLPVEPETLFFMTARRN